VPLAVEATLLLSDPGLRLHRMRYYVVCPSPFPAIEPHIIAEVVQDPILDPSADRRLSFAGALAGDTAIIATRDELLAHPVGVRALEAWDRDDDREFDRETRLLEAAEDDDKRLHLVTDADNHPETAAEGSLTSDERLAIVIQARALRQRARALAAMAAARRTEVLRNQERLARNGGSRVKL
jgi:hypothetical protein